MSPNQIALLSLVVVASLPLFFFMRWLRDPVFTPVQKVYRFLAYLLARFWWRTRWVGKFDLPETGAGVVICNHRSSVDPFFIQSICDRKIRWMVAKEFCDHPLFSWFLGPCEVIPVSRGGVDTSATKEAMRTVENGGLVGMLPEGRINMTDQLLLPVRPGAAMIALRYRAPIIPCFIEGAPYNRVAYSPLLMRANVTVHFGPQVDLSDLYGKEHDEGVLNEAILRCAKALAELAGHPEFEPQLAGRKWKPGMENAAADVEEKA